MARWSMEENFFKGLQPPNWHTYAPFPHPGVTQRSPGTNPEQEVARGAGHWQGKKARGRAAPRGGGAGQHLLIFAITVSRDRLPSCPQKVPFWDILIAIPDFLITKRAPISGLQQLPPACGASQAWQEQNWPRVAAAQVYPPLPTPTGLSGTVLTWSNSRLFISAPSCQPSR